MQRIVVFVDGFNLYHSLCKIARRDGTDTVKWVDLSKLCQLYVGHQTEKIEEILYFTALCTWDQRKKERHRWYTYLLEKTGVEVIWGKYNEVTRKFTHSNEIKEVLPPDCKTPDKLIYKTFEEKKTDVNIALKIFEYAMLDKFDKAIVVSGDSDLIPALEMVKKHYPSKKFTVLLPWKTKGAAICKVAGDSHKIRPQNIESSLFPEEVENQEGEMVRIEDLYDTDPQVVETD